MSIVLTCGPIPALQTCQAIPPNRGPVVNGVGGVFSLGRLPDDAIGTVKISLSGAKAGSEVQFFNYLGENLTGTEAYVVGTKFTLSKYMSISPFNSIRILILNLGYETVDFTIDVPTSDATIPIFQRIDRNYRNPT